MSNRNQHPMKNKIIGCANLVFGVAVLDAGSTHSTPPPFPRHKHENLTKTCILVVSKKRMLAILLKVTGKIGVIHMGYSFLISNYHALISIFERLRLRGLSTRTCQHGEIRDYWFMRISQGGRKTFKGGIMSFVASNGFNYHDVTKYTM